MKIYIIWFISIIKFVVGRKRFLLISPPFFKKQFWYDRKSNQTFIIFIRSSTDWYTNWQVFLEDQFSLSFLTSNLSKSSKEKEVDDYYNQIIKNEYKPLIIDCGSNNGASSIYFSLTYPKAKIISLEIDEGNYLQSLKNIETNKLVVAVLNQGVASEDGYGDFIDPGLGNNAYRIEKASGSTGISLISITSIIKNISYEEKVIPFLVKIDIEGGEKELFSKNKHWIKDFPVMIAELHDWLLPGQTTSLNFLKTISEQNRDFVYRGENVFSISNQFPKIQHPFEKN